MTYEPELVTAAAPGYESDVSETLEIVIHLTRRQVGAEAVTRVVETQERVARGGRGQERGEAVKTAGIVQPAMEHDPLRVPSLVK